MTQQEYDIIKDAYKKVNAPYQKYYEQAKAASEAGKLKLVNEIILEPYNGKGFELKKGQVVRYEIMGGPQTIDLFYMVKSRPMEEWADTFHTACFGPHVYSEGINFFSNSPFCRPLLTFIRDTVDNEKIRELYGERAGHSYVLHNGACSSAIYEETFGTVNSNSCHFNLAQGIMEIAGEEVARRFIQPAAFMNFQIVAFDKVPTALSYFPGVEVMKDGDFVEFLVHDDLYAAISPCPLGDQNDTSDLSKCVNWPFRVAIYEGADGPLETAPDPQHKTAEPFDFIVAGRPGMGKGVVGKP
jgi:uncharacterized protein YcgI (DUF1989 family)